MPITNDRIIQLVIIHLESGLPPAEWQELQDWMDADEENRKAVAVFLDEQELQTGIQEMYASKEKIWARLDQVISHRRITIMRPLWRYVAAAVAVLVLGTVVYTYLHQSRTTITVEQRKDTPNNDVPAPTGSRAFLTLGNGQHLLLDTIANGSLQSSGAAAANKITDEELKYIANKGSAETHTLTVPAGSRPMQLLLADGTKIWLNVASSITYPTAFAGEERKVTLTGEAYFDVAKNKTQPFIVMNGDKRVEVLGTRFNVTAYPDDVSVKITLLEGAVRVAQNDYKKVLQPGQQLQIDSLIKVVRSVDSSQVLAWKNGLFRFHDYTIDEVMREISRWYGVEVVYTGKKTTEHFVSTISREAPMSEVFHILEITGSVHFKIEGRRVLVLQ